MATSGGSSSSTSPSGVADLPKRLISTINSAATSGTGSSSSGSADSAYGGTERPSRRRSQRLSISSRFSRNSGFQMGASDTTNSRFSSASNSVSLKAQRARRLKLGSMDGDEDDEVDVKKATSERQRYSLSVEQQESKAHRNRRRKMDWLFYKFDQALSKRWSQTMAIWSFGVVIVGIGSLFCTSVWSYKEGEDPRNEEDINPFVEGIWAAWTMMADPGTQGLGFYREEQRIVFGVLSFIGVSFWGAILGIVVDMVRERMEKLRQGRSKVIESNHTLILGWTDKTVMLIDEICLANESEGGLVIVVLAPEKKWRMESELALQLPHKQRLGTTVVFRSGTALLVGDLLQVSAHKARSVILQADAGDADTADANTLRAVLSLRSLGVELEGFVVAECRDVDNEPLVKLVGGALVETFVSHDILGRMMLMSARSPGLAKVYEALLGFEGDEFYMQEWPELVGLKFGDLAARFPDAIPIGVRSRVDKYTTKLYLKPSADHLIDTGDEIVVIAADNDTYTPQVPIDINIGDPPSPEPDEKNAEKILFCGWRRDIRDILLHLDSLVVGGTEVTMMSHSVPIRERTAKLLEEGLDVSKLRNIELVHDSGNTSVRRKLEALPIEEYTSCLIFADQQFEADNMHADSHSLATLLLVRDIQLQRELNEQEEKARKVEQARRRTDGVVAEDDLTPGDEKKRVSIQSSLLDSEVMSAEASTSPMICEILDQRTQKSIAGNRFVSTCADFCQSNKWVAQILAMISEERSVKRLLDELLGASGINVVVYPSLRYCTKNEKVSFFTVYERASLLDEIVFGYQVTNSIERTVLNPPDKHVKQSWSKYSFAVLIGDMPGTDDPPPRTSVRKSKVGKKDKSREKSPAARRHTDGSCQTVISYPGIQKPAASVEVQSLSPLEENMAELLTISSGSSEGTDIMSSVVCNYLAMDDHEKVRFIDTLEAMKQFALVQADNTSRIISGPAAGVVEKSYEVLVPSAQDDEFCRVTCGLCIPAAGRPIH